MKRFPDPPSNSQPPQSISSPIKTSPANGQDQHVATPNSPPQQYDHDVDSFLTTPPAITHEQNQQLGHEPILSSGRSNQTPRLPSRRAEQADEAEDDVHIHRESDRSRSVSLESEDSAQALNSRVRVLSIRSARRRSRTSWLRFSRSLAFPEWTNRPLLTYTASELRRIGQTAGHGTSATTFPGPDSEVGEHFHAQMASAIYPQPASRLEEPIESPRWLGSGRAERLRNLPIELGTGEALPWLNPQVRDPPIDLELGEMRTWLHSWATSSITESPSPPTPSAPTSHHFPSLLGPRPRGSASDPAENIRGLGLHGDDEDESSSDEEMSDYEVSFDNHSNNNIVEEQLPKVNLTDDSPTRLSTELNEVLLSRTCREITGYDTFQLFRDHVHCARSRRWRSQFLPIIPRDCWYIIELLDCAIRQQEDAQNLRIEMSRVSNHEKEQHFCAVSEAHMFRGAGFLLPFHCLGTGAYTMPAASYRSLNDGERLVWQSLMEVQSLCVCMHVPGDYNDDSMACFGNWSDVRKLREEKIRNHVPKIQQARPMTPDSL